MDFSMYCNVLAPSNFCEYQTRGGFMTYLNIGFAFSFLMLLTYPVTAFGQQAFAVCRSISDKGAAAINTDAKLDCGTIGKFSLNELGKQKWQIASVMPDSSRGSYILFLQKPDYPAFPPPPPILPMQKSKGDESPPFPPLPDIKTK
jgi:hypothetical protein